MWINIPAAFYREHIQANCCKGSVVVVQYTVCGNAVCLQFSVILFWPDPNPTEAHCVCLLHCAASHCFCLTGFDTDNLWVAGEAKQGDLSKIPMCTWCA